MTAPVSATDLGIRMTMGDKFQRHSFKVAFKLKVRSVRSHILIFDIFENRIARVN